MPRHLYTGQLCGGFISSSLVLVCPRLHFLHLLLPLLSESKLQCTIRKALKCLTYTIGQFVEEKNKARIDFHRTWACHESSSPSRM
ncbi:hypothetical protein BDQ94DRAFT_141398 [Aspergillus welwitschiae]|uniref:Uncharacterized protein n=1 Tax=Aspergillus welwitschiae TaxID=1341132 RepID=A0A3F3Q6M7_9EURO|nr:hypothetical protein BDQ94DRAFT_141398 [Aspergillus welwitschiae]RDH34396.1 hypothetical protein BDQ94DRAFT_141398 [Aspergillus welwitschiae]